MPDGDAMSSLQVGLALIVALVAVAAAFVGHAALATRRIAAKAERTVPRTGRFVDVGGNKLHIVEAGQGPTILFVHGLGGQLHHFRHTLFDRLSSDFHVVAVDRPGSGYSVGAAARTGRLGEQAQVLADLIGALGIEPPLVVGHSLGGAVTLALAIDRPSTIAGMALLAPLSHKADDVPAAFKAMAIRSQAKRWLLSHTFAVPRSLKLAPQTLAFVFGPQAPPEDYIVAGGGILGLRPSHFFATVTDFVAVEDDLADYERRYGDIVMPTGVLFGTADQVLDHRVHGLPLAEAVQKLHLELLDGIGHMPQFVAPDRTEAFIRRIASRCFAEARTPPSRTDETSSPTLPAR